MVLDKRDPTKVTSLTVQVEGDDNPVKTLGEVHQPDNLESTPTGLLITEDPGSSQQFPVGSTDPNATPYVPPGSGVKARSMCPRVWNTVAPWTARQCDTRDYQGHGASADGHEKTAAPVRGRAVSGSWYHPTSRPACR